ncbi:MAG: hypothetical protein PW843_00420 [Azospirillaceae bacterium]|nr:hypothetical protein [Azospirillaceae bacterium]
MPLETPLPSLAHRLRAEFEQRLATALREAGVAAEECVERVRLVIRTAEADSLDIWAIYHLLGNAGRLRELVEAAVGRPVGKLAIAPVPGYFEPLIPLFEKQFDQIVLCDNFKVGKQMSDAPAVIDLPSLQAQLDDVDCILIGTVDQKIRGLFSAQLPAEKTISIYDILDDSVIVSENSIRNARELEGVIREFDNPFIILCHRFTPPYVSTVSALRDAGYDVVILSRFKENAGLGIKQTDLHLLGAKAVYPVNLIENLYLAQVLDHCPWWFLNDGFLHASWSFERATWHYAYTAAMLEMINAPRILCLYDPIKPAIKDWEYEQPALAAWAAAIRRADGVHVGCANQHLVDFMIRQSGGRCPFIGFLRYNLPAHKRRPPRTESFSLALVSPIADEVSDPGTDLRAVIRELLRQGLDLHYYTGSPASWVFRDSLPEEEARHLHVHRQIIDQQELIWEISRYHAGWCVGNFDVFDDIVVKMESREGT